MDGCRRGDLHGVRTAKTKRGQRTNLVRRYQDEIRTAKKKGKEGSRNTETGAARFSVETRVLE